MTSPKKSAIKFARRTSSGRNVSLPRDGSDACGGAEQGKSGPAPDLMSYTVHMPPTPDNQPYTAVGSSNSKPEDIQTPPGKQSGDVPGVAAADNVVSGTGSGKIERGISIIKRSNEIFSRSQTADFDHTQWLFESSGTYGIGNACWTQDCPGYEDDGGISMSDLMDKPWKPLTRKVRVPAVILSPYRLLVLVRLICLLAFLIWRITNSNPDAMWLWGLSVACEIWFAISWILDILPKLNPINRAADLSTLHEKFELPSLSNPMGRSDLPGIDVFISTADPEKEPPLVTANTILSILATEYPVEKLAVYVSDDGAALLTFEAMEEAASFAKVWVPFCRKHCIEPRNPDSYFNLKVDPTKNKKQPDFVKDRRWIKREYDEFKVRINGLPEAILRRSKLHNSKQQKQAAQLAKENGEDPSEAKASVPIATWMTDGSHWPGTWKSPFADHSKGDHAGILQIMIKLPDHNPVYGGDHMDDSQRFIEFKNVDIRVPVLIYISREKRPGYDHNKKAGAMNALVRASAVISNGPFILNFDCDHYVYNSLAIREGMCYMMDRGGDRICYVQYPQRFEGIDPSDRYANHNTVFFDGNMRALDGLQGPMYVGTGCLFRRYALYGFSPPRANEYSGLYGQHKRAAKTAHDHSDDDELQPLNDHPDLDMPKKFGKSQLLEKSIEVAEYEGRPLADHPSVKNGRKPGSLLRPRAPLDADKIAEAVSVISCWYEDKTEWGDRIGWIYGSVTEDVVTGYRMHNRGWRSVYCITKRDAFRGTAPINLTDRLHQVLRWATGSVEIFFSKNNAILASRRLKFLQRIAYINVGVYPFTSIFLLVYCFLPAASLLTGHFVVQSLNAAFLSYLLAITLALSMLSVLEVKWSGISLEEYWRNEQFWVIGGTSAHLAAVLQGLLKVVAGVEISFTLTSKSAADEEEDAFADLYLIKWTALFIPPLTILAVNIVAIFIGVARTLYSLIPQWSKLVGGLFFSFWVLAHMYPFCKGLMGRRGRTPTIVYVWAGLVAITISLLWIAVSPPSADSTHL